MPSVYAHAFLQAWKCRECVCECICVCHLNSTLLVLLYESIRHTQSVCVCVCASEQLLSVDIAITMMPRL